MYVSLFTTFFLARNNSERQVELLHCLKQNVSNFFIKNIYLLLDGKDEEQTKAYVAEHVDTKKIVFVNIKRIPTYGDWIQYSKWFAQDLADVSVFCNADIYVDDTIANCGKFVNHPESIICLSRHNADLEGNVTPHPNPHWSQDLWAISKENILNLTNTYFADELNITTTGVYRCDNKLAFLFAMRGWAIYNPFTIIKCYHVQQDTARTYGRLDTNIIGGLCFPSPTDCPTKPSELDISIMPTRVGNLSKCAINKFLHKNLHEVETVAQLPHM